MKTATDIKEQEAQPICTCGLCLPLLNFTPTEPDYEPAAKMSQFERLESGD